MTDDLTPEERRALDALPRERMPAGLEERVVGAMQDRGFLAKRRRTIVLSGSRVAGLVAAAFALMIGAYSIGLHRGPVDVDRRALEPATRDELGRMNQPPAPVSSQALEKTLSEEMRQAARVPSGTGAAESPAIADADRPNVAELKDEPAAPKPTTRYDAGGSARMETASSDKSAGQVQAFQETPATVPPHTFMLNGSPLIVEAPDSVRVVEDEQGKMLLIYTSDGVIRIHMAAGH